MVNEGILEQAQNFAAEITREYPIRFAYLFGSQARGAASGLSDVDLAVFFEHDYAKAELIQIRGYLIEKGRHYFTRAVDLVSLRDADLFLKYAVIKDGIVIKDSADSARSEFESLALRKYFDFQYYSDIYNNAVITSIKEQTFFKDYRGP